MSSTNEMYRRACSYSFVLSQGSPLYKDDVHTAWIYHHNKTNGGDLFTQNEFYVMACVKWMNRWRYSKSHHKKSFTEFNDDIFSTKTPLQELEEKEAADRIYNKIKAYRHKGTSDVNPSELMTFLFYLEQGYQVKETEKLMGISKRKATVFKNLLKSIIRPMTNPFSGNPCVISRKILRKTFEENPRWKKYFTYDTERGSDANEYYCLYVHKEKDEFLLVKEPERDYKFPV